MRRTSVFLRTHVHTIAFFSFLHKVYTIFNDLRFLLVCTYLIFSVFCSHWRSYQYYIESVLDDKAFLATKCDNWKNYLNGDCDSNTKINMGFSTTNR